jgi:hypothetical protein
MNPHNHETLPTGHIQRRGPSAKIRPGMTQRVLAVQDMKTMFRRILQPYSPALCPPRKHSRRQ